MEKMASRPTLSLEDEVVVVGVKSVITIDDYSSFSDKEDSEVQFLKTISASSMPAYQQEQDVVIIEQVKKGNAPHYPTKTTALEDNDHAMAVAVAEQDGWCSQYTRKRTTTALEDNDHAMAVAVSEQDGWCSQYTRKRQRSRPFKCNICLEDNLDGWKGFSLGKCNHRFCTVCLAGLVKSNTGATTSGTTTNIPCPQVECKETLFLSDIQYIFQNDPTAWHTFSESISMTMLENEIAQGGSTRRCPAELCNYTFCYETAVGQNEGTKFTCPQCIASFCLACKANQGLVGPAHEGSCAERMQQLQQQAEERQKLEDWKRDNSQADARFTELIQRESRQGITKPCPNCKQMITKNGGCDHMNCCKCKHNFHWSKAPLPP